MKFWSVRVRAAALCALSLLLSDFASGDELVRSTRVMPLYDEPGYSEFRVPAPPRQRAKAFPAVQATISVNFLPAGPGDDGDVCATWPVAAQAAMNYAASIWASLLQSSVPIVIDACYATGLGAGVLGHAGPTNFARGFPGAPVSNQWFPIALANALSGTDRNGAAAEIYMAFSSTFTWYFGTDQATPVGTKDFVSVVLHEIGHGLGFTGSMEVASGSGSWGSGSGFAFRYDNFTQNNAGQSLINTGIFTNPSAALAAALTSNAVFFSATNANAANGGSRVPLYAPATWNGGSSFSHLAESFNGTPNALMTFSLAGNESIHSPGPVTLGILQDIGWVLSVAPPVIEANISVTQAATPPAGNVAKDIVYTLTINNAGPSTAVAVQLTDTIPAGSTFVWASPLCTHTAGTVTCVVGDMTSGQTLTRKVVVRPASAATIANNVTVSSSTTDSVPANNTSSLNVTVSTNPAAQQVLRYRLYSPVTLEHHFTTDLNEYNVLGGFVGTWLQEGTVGKVLDNPGSFNAVAAVPYYRLYDQVTRWHHWTTDANEYYTLAQFPTWNAEGVDGYILPSQPVGAIQLFRLNYPFVPGLHHWTIDAAEYNALTTQFGWVGEGGAGFVIQ